MAKITITMLSSDFSEVINSLKLTKEFKDNTEFTIDLEIEDCKENFIYLSSSEKIKNWDFIKEDINSKEIDKKKIPLVEDLPIEKTAEVNYDKEVDVFSILNNSNFENNSQSLLKLIKLSWDLSRKNLRLVPSNLYPNMINGVIISNLKYKEDEMIDNLIKRYYLDCSFSESLEHLIKVIKSNWVGLRKCETLTEIVTLLLK